MEQETHIPNWVRDKKWYYKISEKKKLNKLAPHIYTFNS